MSSVRSYPPTRPHRIMTSTLRAYTEPTSNGFMQSVMRQHTGVDDLDKRIMMANQPETRMTQEEQDAEDEKTRKRAMKNLVSSWQERLRLISVITTFFATTEAAMLVNTKPLDGYVGSTALQASNACLLGALVLHVYASVLSFLGAAMLIRYKLKEATREEMIAEGIKLANSPTGRYVIEDIERDVADGAMQEQRTITANSNDTQFAISNFIKNVTTTSTERNKTRCSSPLEPPILSRNPRVEQVGLFMSNVSTHLLSRTHGLCVSLAAIGFVLAIVGIMCYAWSLESLAVKAFASGCLGFAVVGMAILRL